MSAHTRDWLGAVLVVILLAALYLWTSTLLGRLLPMTLAARAEVVARTALARDWNAIEHTARVVAALPFPEDTREQLRLGGGSYDGYLDWRDMLVAVAWLHDVVEDTHLEVVDLADLGFPVPVTAAVRLLSRSHLTDYMDYVAQIVHAHGRDGEIARIVKLADARENLARCEASVGVPKWQRLAENRYRPAIRALEANTH